MKISEILLSTKGLLLNGNEDDLVESFSIDSRNINNNDFFIAIKGEKFDGNDFIFDVLNKGCKGVIFDKNIDIDFKKYKDKIFIKVNNSIKALQDMARYKRSLYDTPVVAITGSVGKTSTKDIIASVMSEKYNVLKTEGNHNNHIGLPLTLLKLKDHNAMCIEMGMNHFNEISLLTNILKPTIAVITNIGTAHIGNLGSRENILKAKLEILEGLKENGNIIINNDNDLLHKWYIDNKAKYNIITYGIENESKYQAKNILNEIENSTFDINNVTKNIFVPVPGNHFIYNSLCAFAVGKILNISNEMIKEGIKKFELSKNRIENIDLPNDIRLISDCYNANYDSMKAAIELLSKYKERKIAVLGDMLELGKYSEKIHSNIGKLINDNIDILICSGEMSKYIYNNSKTNKKYYCNNNKEVEELLKDIILPKDTILFKASNSMNFTEIVNNIKNHLK